MINGTQAVQRPTKSYTQRGWIMDGSKDKDLLSKSVAASSVELQPKQKDALVSYLGRLDCTQRGLGERALCFVLTGEDEAVLEMLSASRQCGRDLQLKVCMGSTTKPTSFEFPEIYQTPGAEPLFYWRLAKVFEAASRCERTLFFASRADLPEWFEILLWEVSTYLPSSCGFEVWISHEMAEAILSAAGKRTDSLVRAILLKYLDADSPGYQLLKSVAGLGGAVERHPDVVREALKHPSAEMREQALGLLAVECSPVPFVDLLLAIRSPKKARAAAETWLAAAGEKCVPVLRSIAVDGKQAQRVRAIEAIWQVGGSAEREFLKLRRVRESAPRAIAMLDKILQAAPEANDACRDVLPKVELGSLPPLPITVRDLLLGIVSAMQVEVGGRVLIAGEPVLAVDAVDEWFRFLQDPSVSIDDVELGR